MPLLSLTGEDDAPLAEAAPAVVILRLARYAALNADQRGARRSATPDGVLVSQRDGGTQPLPLLPLAYSVEMPEDGTFDLAPLSADGAADMKYYPIALLEHCRPQRRLWQQTILDLTPVELRRAKLFAFLTGTDGTTVTIDADAPGRGRSTTAA
eukprot:gene16105-17903_t